MYEIYTWCEQNDIRVELEKNIDERGRYHFFGMYDSFELFIDEKTCEEDFDMALDWLKEMYFQYLVEKDRI